MGSTTPAYEFYDAVSDTVSETTISSSSSFSSFKLPEGHVKEKVKVDRRKLEAMILRCPPDPWDTQVMKIPFSSDGRVMPIDEFFQTIMDKTSTEIKYPKFLEIGARNKKDPQIYITGLPDRVEQAAQLVSIDLMPQLKIQMKIDVPWTHHSHIIGKGGGNIQSVTKRTGVSIHFPDANKQQDVPKSNQVTITSRGQDLNGAETARSAIRDLTPLVFRFYIHACAEFVRFDLINHRKHLEQQVEKLYNVQVSFRLIEEPDVFLSTVKGLESDSARVIEAVKGMLVVLCPSIANRMPVETCLEISDRHREFVLGYKGINIQRIMQKTQTNITLNRERNCLTLAGAIDDVYSALQKTIGSLPIMITFDLPPDNPIDQSTVMQLANVFNVHVDANVYCKAADGRYTVRIKSEERNAKNVYEVWRRLSKLSCEQPKMKIPHTYFIDSEIQTLLPVYLPTPSPSPTYSCDNRLIDTSPVTVVHNEPTPPPPPVFNNNIGEQTSSFQFPYERDSEDQRSFFETITDRKVVGVERKFIDYLTKKSLAFKVMKEPITSQPRTPTPQWSGLGLSKSGPAFSFFSNSLSSSSGTSGGDHSSGLSDLSSGREVSATAYEPFGAELRQAFTSTPSAPGDLTSLLSELHLEQYIDSFVSNEVDIDLLKELTDKDLKEIGVNAFGHRKKLLLAIKNLSLEGN